MNIKLSHKNQKQTPYGIWVRNPENLKLLISASPNNQHEA